MEKIGPPASGRLESDSWLYNFEHIIGRPSTIGNYFLWLFLFSKWVNWIWLSWATGSRSHSWLVEELSSLCESLRSHTLLLHRCERPHGSQRDRRHPLSHEGPVGWTGSSSDGRCQALARCLRSPVFYFYLFIFWLWTGTWVRIRSGLDAFYWFLIFHISSWCMDVFSWAGAIAVGLSSCVYIFLLSPQHRLGLQLLLCSPGISFHHLTPSIVQHEFPSPSLYLCRFLYYQLPAFFLNGYLGNSRPCVSRLVQRLSPKYLCILGISVCAPYPSIEENTSFSSLSIWIS